jgi:hypothetical protein
MCMYDGCLVCEYMATTKAANSCCRTIRIFNCTFSGQLLVSHSSQLKHERNQLIRIIVD